MAALRLRDGREVDVQVEEINGEVRIPVVVRKGTTIAIDAVEKGEFVFVVGTKSEEELLRRRFPNSFGDTIG